MKIRTIWPVILSVILSLGSAVSCASDAPAAEAGVNQLGPEAAGEIDKVFAAYGKAGSPGCAVGVLKDGVLVFNRGYGWADLEHSVPITPETVFESGSVAKQFTAGAVQLLVQDGRLSLDDDVRKHLPEVPDFGRTITIRHLLTHTSGLRDQWTLLSAAGRPTGSVVHTLDEILDLVSRQRDLNFAPGEDYLYSNTGYSLLAWVVLRVTGKSLAEFSRERIFTPLGMKSTHWRDDFREVVPGRAIAYSAGPGGRFRQNMPFTNVYGNGGLLTTVGDLLTWAENFWNPRVIGRALLDQMEVPAVLEDGTRTVYGLGLGTGEYRGLRIITHGGSTAGYRAYLVRFPGPHVAVAVLSNFAGVIPGDLAFKVADVVLAGRLGEKVKPARIAVEPSRLQDLAGLYHNPKTDAVVRLAVREGKLWLAAGGRPLELIPVGEERFVTEDGPECAVERTAEGGLRLRVMTRGERESVFSRVETVRPTAAILADYAGLYWSDELLVLYEVSVRNGKLSVRLRPDQPVALEPTCTDAFIEPQEGSAVRFLRGPAGKIDGLSLYLGRVRRLKFKRLEDGPAVPFLR